MSDKEYILEELYHILALMVDGLYEDAEEELEVLIYEVEKW